MVDIEKPLEKSYIQFNQHFADDGLHTIPDCLRHFADTLEDNEAMVFASFDGGRQAITWREIFEKARNTAKALIELGVKEGEIVGINVRPCPEWLYLWYGAMMMGAIPVGLSFTYKDGSDLIALMKKLEKCCLLVVDPGLEMANWNIAKSLIDSFSSNGTASSTKIPYLRYLIVHEETEVIKGVMHYVDMVCNVNVEIDQPQLRADSIAFMIQTSGSTGLPKLVAHTHKSVMALRQTTYDGFFNKSMVLFNDRPFQWSGGYPFNLIVGQKRVTVSGFSPQPADKITAMIEIIKREKCTCVMALPPLLHALISKKPCLQDDWPVQTCLSGGQPMSKVVLEAIGSVSPSLVVAYGGTEFLFIISDSIREKDKFGDFYTGKITSISGLEIQIVDENACIVPVNCKGEIYVRSPTLFKEYYNDPERTSKVMTSDGWYKTDDIGMMTPDGHFYVYGRKSSVIISGGMNVTPEIIEQSIRTCPDVAQVIVVPVPDDVYYQVLCACVLRKTGSKLTEDQLRTYCSEMHNDKPGLFTVLPKYYLFLETFPETSTGKNSRLELTTMAAKLFSK